MLVISQKEKGQILIGKDITIRVLELTPGRVKLGIEAPSDVKIKRVDIAAVEQREHSYPAQKRHKIPATTGKKVEDSDLSEK